jgi:hypothetical protein
LKTGGTIYRAYPNFFASSWKFISIKFWHEGLLVYALPAVSQSSDVLRLVDEHANEGGNFAPARASASGCARSASEALPNSSQPTAALKCSKSDAGNSIGPKLTTFAHSCHADKFSR